MSPACSLLGIVTPKPPEVQPFRFMDLPIEIRYMVYEKLMGRRVRVTVPDLGLLPGCVSDTSTQVVDCFYPAVMRTNKQLASEYASISMSSLLATSWTMCDDDTAHAAMQSDQAQLPMLPGTILNLVEIFLDIPTPHCDVQAAIRTLTSKMFKLDLLMLSTEYNIDHLVSESSLADGEYFYWTDEMIYLLQELVSEEDVSRGAMAKFYITCPLYCLLDSSEEEDEAVLGATCAICEGPDEETFALNGMNLKFMRTSAIKVRLKAIKDSNVFMTIFPRENDWQGEE